MKDSIFPSNVLLHLPNTEACRIPFVMGDLKDDDLARREFQSDAYNYMQVKEAASELFDNSDANLEI